MATATPVTKDTSDWDFSTRGTEDIFDWNFSDRESTTPDCPTHLHEEKQQQSQFKWDTAFSNARARSSHSMEQAVDGPRVGEARFSNPQFRLAELGVSPRHSNLLYYESEDPRHSNPLCSLLADPRSSDQVYTAPENPRSSNFLYSTDPRSSLALSTNIDPDSPLRADENVNIGPESGSRGSASGQVLLEQSDPAYQAHHVRRMETRLLDFCKVLVSAVTALKDLFRRIENDTPSENWLDIGVGLDELGRASQLLARELKMRERGSLFIVRNGQVAVRGTTVKSALEAYLHLTYIIRDTKALEPNRPELVAILRPVQNSARETATLLKDCP